VTAPYEKTSSDGTSARVQILFVKYANPERARKALDEFHSAYLEDHPKEFNQGNAKKQMNSFKIEDGWVGYALDGTGLSIVFECPNRDTAELIIKHIQAVP
jgi:hypothetical protein